MKTLNKLYSIAKEFVKEYESNIKEIEVNEPKQVGKLIKIDKSSFIQVYNCYTNCLTYFPKHLHPKNEKTWIDTIEKLNRIDGVPFLEIERIVKATREDSFWSQNFLSMTKLRKKKDEVYYIVIFGEKFKPKEKLINRQSQAVIESNLTNWRKR
jgi:hypothetical protein